MERFHAEPLVLCSVGVVDAVHLGVSEREVVEVLERAVLNVEEAVLPLEAVELELLSCALDDGPQSEFLASATQECPAVGEPFGGYEEADLPAADQG